MIIFKKNSILSIFVPVILLTIIALPAIFGLIKNGLPVGDDATWMVIRFSAFYEQLSAGQFPVRFATRLNNGYGYPVMTFLYPGFMYLAVPIKALGFGFVDSIKILLGISFITSGYFMYFWLRRFFDNVSSFLGSVMYLYTPYHLFDLYTRGSVGEVLLIAVLPFILFSIEKKSRLFTALGIGFLLISHNSLAFIFFPLLLIYSLISKSFSRIQTIIVFTLGILLSSFFWIPALYELRYTKFSNTTISDPSQYFSDISLIGYSTIALILLCFFVMGKIYIQKTKPIHYPLFIFFFLFFFGSLYFSSFLSQIIWSGFLVKILQFPFRFLSILLVCLSFVSAFTFFHLNPKIRYVLGTIFIGLVMFSSSSIFLNVKSEIFPDELYSTNQATTTVHDEYMPKWVKEIPQSSPQKKVEVISGNAEIVDLSFNTNFITFTAIASDAAKLQINTIYYPGWNLQIDGERKEILYNNNAGLINLNIPGGKSLVNISFSETLIRLLSDVLTLAAFILLVLYSAKDTWELRKFISIWKK